MRPARASDREALLALYAEVDELHVRLQPAFFRREYDRDTQVAARIRAGLAGGFQVLLVASDDGERVCGLCFAQAYDTPPADSMVPRRRVHIEDLVVAAADRRTGCGRALLAAATEWAKHKGAAQLLLTVWSGNAEAERFYQSLGYKPISQVLGTDL